MLDDLADWLRRPNVTIALVGVLMLGGFLVDLTTRQDLVVAIIYNVPIAISGAWGQSQRLTRGTLVLALGANVAAAYENALNFGGYDQVSLANRGFSALSFLIVGAMTLARETAADEVTSLSGAEAAAERERALRRLVRDLSDQTVEQDLIHAAVPALRELLDAEVVVISGLRDGRFCEPHYGDAGSEDLAPLGSLASWAVDAIPRNDSPAITVRSERGLFTSGRWRREDGPDLIVLADVPRAEKSAYLLGEALHAMEPLLHRARRAEAIEVPALAEEADASA